MHLLHEVLSQRGKILFSDKVRLAESKGPISQSPSSHQPVAHQNIWWLYVFLFIIVKQTNDTDHL